MSSTLIIFTDSLTGLEPMSQELIANTNSLVHNLDTGCELVEGYNWNYN